MRRNLTARKLLPFRRFNQSKNPIYQRPFGFVLDMLTLLLILFPFIAAVITAAIPDKKIARNVAIGASLLEFTAFLPLLVGGLSYNLIWFKEAWVPALGINFYVGMDGVTTLLVFLTTALFPLILFSADRDDYGSRFYALALMMLGALVGVFTARDGFLFYIFWELALIPIWFICLLFGGEGRERITLKFFLYTLLGSLFMLLGIIYLYLATPNAHSFDWAILKTAHQALSANEQSLIFWAFFLSFAIKMPIFPFHTWQPDTYTNAPTQGTMLLSGIMLKMGIFGAMYWLIPMVPLGVTQWQPLVIVLSIIGLIYGSVIAIQQRDAKRLVAYSSFAHVGLIAAGVFAHTYSGMQGATMQMLAHGFNVVGLFYIIDLIERKTKTRQLADLGGIATNDKTFAVLSFIIVLGSIAMPLTNAFVGEFMLLLGVYQYNLWAGVMAGLTIILGAVYMLKFYKKAFFGETTTATIGTTFMDDSTSFILFPIAAIVILMGVCPKPFMDLAAPAIMELLK